MDLLEARVQAAMLRNRMVRLDNPVLRARIACVHAKASAAAVALPQPAGMAAGL